MSNELMAQMKIKGHRGKMAFQGTGLCQAVLGKLLIIYVCLPKNGDYFNTVCCSNPVLHAYR